VIVESPARRGRIERILRTASKCGRATATSAICRSPADEIPDEIRKKKWGRLGVDTEGNFRRYYVIERQEKVRPGVARGA